MGDHHKRIRRCSVGKEGLFSPPLVSLPPQTSTSRNGEGGGIFRCKGPSSDPLELRGMGLRSGSSSSSGGSDKENAAPARPNSLSSSMDTVGIRAVAPARPAPTTTSTSTLTSLSTSTATSSYHPHRNARLGRPSKGAGGPGPPQLLIPMLRDDGETPLARKKMSTKKSTKNKSDNVAISGAPSGATVSGTLSPLLPSPEGPARRRGGAGGLFGPTATSSYHPHRNARLGRPSKGAGGPGPPQLLIPMLRDDGETPLARKKMSTKKSTKNKSDNVAISGAPSGATVSGTLSPLLPSPEGPARRRGGAGGLFGPDSRGGGGLFGSDPISSPIPSPIRSVPAVARRAHVRVRSLASEARKMSVDLMDSNPEDDDGDENGGNEVHTEPTPAASSTPPRIPLRLPSRPSPIPDFHGSVGGSAAVGPTRPSLSPRMGAGLGLAPRVTLTRRPSSKVVGLKRRNISPVGTLPSSTRAPVLPQSPSLPPPMPGQRGRRRHADAGGLADHLDDRATLALPGFGSAPLAAGPGLFGDTTPNALDASPTAMETTVDSNCHRSVAGGGSRSGSSPSPTETPRGSLRGGGGFLPFSFASAAATPRASPHPGAAASAGPDGRGLFQSPHWSRSVHINPFSPVPSQYLNVEEVEGGCDAFGDILVDLNGSTGGGGGDGVDERYYSVNGSPLRSPRPFRVSLSSPKSSPRPMDAPPPTARKSNNKRALRARLLDSYPVSTSWDEMDDENDYTKDNSAPFYPKTKRRNSLDGNIPNVEEESLFGTRDNVIFRSGAPLGGRKSSGKTTEVGGGGDGVDERYYSVNGSPLRSPRPFRVSLSSPKSSPRPMDAPPPTARKSNNKRALRARLLDSYPVSTSWDEMDDENDYTKDNSAPFYPKTKRRNSLDGNIPNVEEESLFGTRDNVIFRSGAPLGGRKSSGKTTEVSPVDVAGFPCVPLAADSPTLMGMTPLNPAKRRNGRGARHHLSPFSAPPASPLRTSNSPKLSFAYMPSASPSWSPTTRARPSYYRRPTPFKPSQPPPLERGGHHHHHHYDDDADLLRSPHWTGSKEDTRLQRSHPLTPHGGHESSSQCRVSRFEEDFQAVGRLGTGSFGTVHKVISRLDGCLYAVKVMKRPVRGDLDRRQTLKEVHALAALCGQSDASAFHIVRYHQAWMEDGLVHIQIELCESTLVHEMKGGMLNGDDRRYKLLREMLLALELIHRNEMVHLDIKVRCTIWYWEA